MLNALMGVAQDTLEDLVMDLPYSYDHPSKSRLYIHNVFDLFVDDCLGSSIKPAILVALSHPQKLRALTLSLDTGRSWDLPTFQPLKAAAEILDTVPAKRLNYLNVIWSPGILTSLALDARNASRHSPLKALKDSITRLPLRTVVFSAPRRRKNRCALWIPALERAFPVLRERGILKIAERPLTCEWPYLLRTIRMLRM